MSETDDLLGGTYRRFSRIGAGGMGDVYEVEHVRLQARFAAKVLRCGVDDAEDKRSRFLREARLLARLKSDHIVRVFDVSGDEHDPPFYVMELLEGHDLRRLLQSERRLSVPRAVNIVLDACAGVGVAHAAGLVHRDLKPENLFITHRDSGEEVCKLLDFGVSKSTGPTTTETGALVGTIAYMAPEQVESAGTVTPQADVYSLGAILYELLAGRPPHRADSVERLLFKILSGEPEPLATLRPELPLELQRIVQRALARQACDRFADVHELALALRSLDMGGGAAHETTLREARREPDAARGASSRRSSLRLALVAVAAVPLALAVLLSSRTPGHATSSSDLASNPPSKTAAQTPADMELSAVTIPVDLERPAAREPTAAAAPLVKPRVRRVERAAPGTSADTPSASVAPVPELRIEVQNPYAR